MYIGDTVKIKYMLNKDVDTATLLLMKYWTPKKTKGNWIPTLVGTRDLEYDLVPAEAGVWHIQPYIEMPGFAGHAQIKTFEIFEHL